MKTHHYLLVVVVSIASIVTWKLSAPSPSDMRISKGEETQTAKSWTKSSQDRVTRMPALGDGMLTRDMPPELQQFMSLLETSAEAGLPGFYDQAMQFKGEEQRIALYGLARKWVSLNPTAAADYSLEIVNPDQAEEFLRTVLSVWPTDSIQRGFNWLASIGDGSKKQRMLETFLFRVVTLDPNSAADYVAALPEGQQKSAMISRMIQTWARTAPEAALNWANQSLSGNSKAEALASIGKSIVNTDPARAAALLETIPFGLQRDSLLKDIAAKWIEVDAKLAVGWLEGLEPADRDIAVMTMAAGWASSQPLDAVAFASNLANDQRDQFLEVVAGRWAQDDPTAVIDWIKSSRETLPRRVLQSAFDSWSAQDPKKASQSINDFNDGKTQVLLASVVARNWGRNDPNGASEYALSLPEGAAREEVVSRVMTHWSRSDPMEASKWLATLDPGPSKDKGIVELAFATSKSDPSSALLWTMEINNAVDRQKWMQRIGKDWIASDRAEAESAIMKMGLSFSERRQLGME